MTFQELQEMNKLKQENQLLKREIGVTHKEIKTLTTTNKFNLQIIEDLDKSNYKEKYETSNKELKALNKQLKSLKYIEENDYKGKYESSIKEIEFLKKKSGELRASIRDVQKHSKNR